jgi:hypothetical protein
MLDQASRQQASQVVDPASGHLDPVTAGFYRRAMASLNDAALPFLVGGAYALERHTGIARHTKDFDIFVRPSDRDRVLNALAAAGYHTELAFPHWLGKAFHRDAFVDVIWSSGNGIAQVDDEWFTYAVTSRVLAMPAWLCPPEEMIWSKAFVMERERYDGNDVAHLLRGCGDRLAWRRLLRRFGPHWRILLGHLVLFGFIYPSERSRVPAWVTALLSRRLADETDTTPPGDRLCRGTLLSRVQYLIDVSDWGYQDARCSPTGSLSDEDIARWTAAAAE